MSRLVLATANSDKVVEIRSLLSGLDLEPVGVGDLVEGWHVEETGTTLAENASLKARAAVKATGSPALADDTGLFVDALDGAPGVHSSRFAGPDATYRENVAELLRSVEDVPRDRRTARFRTVALLRRHDGVERGFEGVLEGRITREPRGESGFGYDPVFEVEETGRTLAELPPDRKNRISHRSRALAALAAFLAARPGWLEGENGPV